MCQGRDNNNNNCQSIALRADAAGNYKKCPLIFLAFKLPTRAGGGVRGGWVVSGSVGDDVVAVLVVRGHADFGKCGLARG